MYYGERKWKDTSAKNLNSKGTQKEENMKREESKDTNVNDLPDATFVDIVTGLAEYDKIANCDDVKKLASNTSAAIFYGCNNKMDYMPNPFDVAMKNINEAISIISDDTSIRRSIYNGNKGYRSRTIIRLNGILKGIIHDTYKNAISNNLISFFYTRISLFLDGLFTSEYLNNMLGLIFAPDNLSFSLYGFINDISDFLCDKNLSVENRNSIIIYNEYLTRCSILESLSSSLNEIARAGAFGSPYTLNNCMNGIMTNGVNDDTRKEFMCKTFFTSDTSELQNKSIIFGFIIAQLSADLENIIPLIDALLWQIIALMEKTLTDELKEFNSEIYYNNYSEVPFDPLM